MNQKECIELFNKITYNIPVDLNSSIIPLIYEFLTDINAKNIEKLIELIVENPILISETLPKVINHICIKYQINYVSLNGKTILYYDGTNQNN